MDKEEGEGKRGIADIEGVEVEGAIMEAESSCVGLEKKDDEEKEVNKKGRGRRNYQQKG